MRAAQYAGEEALARALQEVMTHDRQPNGTVRLEIAFRYLVATV